MIEINLLPHREARRAAELRESMLALAVGIALMGVAIFLVDGMMNKALNRNHVLVEALETEVQAMLPQEKKLADFKKRKLAVEEKLAVIESLNQARSGPVRMLDELASQTPDRLWLTRLETMDGRVSLEGESFDTGVVADFLRALNSSQYFDDVDLVKTDGDSPIDGVELVTFEISAAFINNRESVESSDSQPAGT